MEELPTTGIHIINTECSPSYIPNNLTISDLEIYYVHNSEIQPRIIVLNKDILSNPNSKDNLSKYVSKLNGNESLQISCINCCINNGGVIAVGLYGGFKIWNKEGNRLLYHLTDNSYKDKPFTITAISERKSESNKDKSIQNYIIFGDSFGNIYQCSGSNTSWTNTKIFSNKNNLSVTSLVGLNDDYIAAAYENGEIKILDCKKTDNSDTKTTILSSEVETFTNEYDLPCLCISSVDNNKYLVVGLVNGEIRIYSIKSLSLICTFQSHSRMINALSCVDNYIATASDDCYINVLSFNNEKLKVIKSLKIPNKMPVGVKLLKVKENKISLIGCCFDNPNLVYYEDISK